MGGLSWNRLLHRCGVDQLQRHRVIVGMNMCHARYRKEVTPSRQCHTETKIGTRRYTLTSY